MKKFIRITALALLICVMFTDSVFYAQSDTLAVESEQEFPQFTAGTLIGEQDDEVDGQLFVYENTTAADFDAYCGALENASYTLKYNYEPGYGKFAAYVKGSETVYFYYMVNTSETRVIRDMNGVLPEFEEKYTKRQEEDNSYFTPVIKKATVETELIAQPKITQLNVLYSEDNHGMAYVVTLSDGSFILIDGGNNWEPQHTHIWNALNSMNERPDGKIIIRAWIVTHLHADHTRALTDFAINYGSQCELGYLICNVNRDLDEGFPSDLRDYLLYFGGSPEFLVPHSGQRISILESIVEIIGTHEDFYPTEITDFNDTSMIFRVHLGGQSAMFVGDAQVLAGDTAVKNMKGYLASDFVQVSHHGYGDIGYSFYKEVGAPFGFWPHEISYYEQYSRTSDSSDVSRTQFWSEKNMIYHSMSHIEVADPSTAIITLPFDFKYDEVSYLVIPD